MMRFMSHFAKTQSRVNPYRATVWRLLLAMAVVVVAAGLARAEPLQDGPYVLRAADGSWYSRWIEGQSEGPRVRAQTIEIGKVVTVGAVGTFPAFDVELRGPAQPARDDIPVGTRTPL